MNYKRLKINYLGCFNFSLKKEREFQKFKRKEKFKNQSRRRKIEEQTLRMMLTKAEGEQI